MADGACRTFLTARALAPASMVHMPAACGCPTRGTEIGGEADGARTSRPSGGGPHGTLATKARQATRGTVSAQGMAQQGGAGDRKQAPLLRRSRLFPAAAERLALGLRTKKARKKTIGGLTMGRLEERVIIVTGGRCHGIGRALLCKAWPREGARVLAADLEPVPGAEAVAKALGAEWAGGPASAGGCGPAGSDGACGGSRPGTLWAQGWPDQQRGAVSAPGPCPVCRVTSTPWRIWDRLMAANLWGVFHAVAACCRAIHEAAGPGQDR